MHRPPCVAPAVAVLAALSAASLLATQTVTARTLAGNRPLSAAPLPPNNATLGTVDVTLAAGGDLTLVDSSETRAGVVTGLAGATDWMSVGDVSAVQVVVDGGPSRVGAGDGATSVACGASGRTLTYRTTLTPAVLPTRSQADQLIKAADSVARALRSLGVAADVSVSGVTLDDSLLAASPAPFPPGATGDAALTVMIRVTGAGVSLCPPAGVLLPALRALRINTTYGAQQYLEYARQHVTNTTVPWSAYVQDSAPFYNAANSRFVGVMPRRLADLQLTTAFALAQFGDSAAVADVWLEVAGLTRSQARAAMALMLQLSRSGFYSRLLSDAPGVGVATVLFNSSSATYGGRPLGGLPAGTLAAAIAVPLGVMAAALVGVGIVLRRRAGAAVQQHRAGSGKPSDLLRALAEVPATTPLDRLAAVTWELDPAQLQIVKDAAGKEVELGVGGYGVVYRGRHAGRDVAIKILKSDRAADREDLAKEVLMLRGCRHPNIVGFVGAILRDQMPSVLVTELMDRGCLYNALLSNRMGAVFQWRRLRTDSGRPRPGSGMNRRIALDVARGLAYLHSLSIIHLDIKSLNVLLAKDLTAKIADVGLARVLAGDALDTLSAPAGTLAWMAPEVMVSAGCAVNEKADIFSYGVVLWELSTRMKPRRPLPPLTEDDAPPAICALVDACVAPDATKRPTAADIVAILEAMDDDCEPVEAPAKLSQRVTSWAVANYGNDGGGKEAGC